MNPDHPRYFKELVLYRLIFLAVFGGIFVLAISVPELVSRDYWITLIVVVGAYLSGLAIFLTPSLSYRIRSLWLCAALYATGVSIILSLGPFVASREWLLSFSIAAAIMMGWAGAIASLAINALTYLIIGFLLARGFWPDPALFSDSLANWVQVALDLFLLNFIITLTVAYIFRRLEESDHRTKEAARLFFKERNDLVESRKLLNAEIEERKRTQEKISALRAREKKILDSIAAGILIVSPKGRSIVYANFAAASMLRTDQESLIGRPCDRYLCSSQNCSCPIFDGGREVYNSERELILAGGHKLTILKTAIPIVFEGRDCLLETFVDVSERKRLESQLAQSHKMEAVGTLAGGVAHDFNNILYAIIGFTELLIARNSQAADDQRYLEKILGAGYRARNLVEQILSFSRKNEPEKRPLRIEPLIREGLEQFRPTLPATINLWTDLNSETNPIRANPDQVRQVLGNLCTNAVEAMTDRPGVLSVSLDNLEAEEPITGLQGSLPPGRYVVLKVSDTGLGMGSQELNRIFEPFYTTKETGQGPGMGLAVVHGIVSGHGGLIKVESEKELGSEFSVYFHSCSEETEGDEAGQPSPHDQGGRILFVGHSQPATRPAREYLERLGYDLMNLASGPEAWEVIERRPDGFDLLITHLTLPGLSGVELAKRIAALRPELPVILCTGPGELVSEVDALSLGTARFLSKPLDPVRTEAMVRELLGRSLRGRERPV